PRLPVRRARFAGPTGARGIRRSPRDDRTACADSRALHRIGDGTIERHLAPQRIVETDCV
ncbi:hypothetical protein, partial [Nocardia sp. CC201C]|uniref:hypothetical protein n=1 Tax=Nocardia sp. CC201C TaxID=3044575 RepID=UPI0024A8E227